jgi:hypothetical protein
MPHMVSWFEKHLQLMKAGAMGQPALRVGHPIPPVAANRGPRRDCCGHHIERAFSRRKHIKE